jgi:hypothetical protein
MTANLRPFVVVRKDGPGCCPMGRESQNSTTNSTFDPKRRSADDERHGFMFGMFLLPPSKPDMVLLKYRGSR